MKLIREYHITNKVAGIIISSNVLDTFCWNNLVGCNPGYFMINKMCDLNNLIEFIYEGMLKVDVIDFRFQVTFNTANYFVHTKDSPD